MAVTGTEAAVLLAGRVLFGGVLAFMGLNHFLQRAEMTGYAEAKGLPAPGAAVVASGLVLVLGGLGIVLGAFPVLSAAAVAGFLLVSAVLMHDFWTVEGEQQQQEMTQFLKNTVMAGGALFVAALGGQSWAFSAGLGLF